MRLLDRIRGDKGDGPGVQGALGYFHLGDWWLTSFTEEERDYIDDKHRPMGGLHDRPLTQGSGANSGTAAGLLVSLSTWFMGPGDRHLAIRMIEKADSLTGNNVLDHYFVYSQMIKAYYADRETQPGALDAAVAACERQIAIAPQAFAAFMSEYHMPAAEVPLPGGYQQLAIIREKQGNFAEALRLCREAESQGYGDWTGGWSKRIARLERRLSKTA